MHKKPFQATCLEDGDDPLGIQPALLVWPVHFSLPVVRGHCSLAESLPFSVEGSLLLTCCTAPKKQELLFDLQVCPMKQGRFSEGKGATKCKQALRPVPPEVVLALRSIQTQLPKLAQKPAVGLRILQVMLWMVFTRIVFTRIVSVFFL